MRTTSASAPLTVPAQRFMPWASLRERPALPVSSMRREKSPAAAPSTRAASSAWNARSASWTSRSARSAAARASIAASSRSLSTALALNTSTALAMVPSSSLRSRPGTVMATSRSASRFMAAVMPCSGLAMKRCSARNCSRTSVSRPAVAVAIARHTALATSASMRSRLQAIARVPTRSPLAPCTAARTMKWLPLLIRASRPFARASAYFPGASERSKAGSLSDR